MTRCKQMLQRGSGSTPNKLVLEKTRCCLSEPCIQKDEHACHVEMVRQGQGQCNKESLGVQLWNRKLVGLQTDTNTVRFETCPHNPMKDEKGRQRHKKTKKKKEGKTITFAHQKRVGGDEFKANEKDMFLL